MVGWELCCLVELYKYKFYRKFRETRLYRYAAAGDWDKIPRRCKSHPHEAKFIHKHVPCDTALHRVLRSTGPFMDRASKIRLSIDEMRIEAVSALLAASPSAANTTDSFGRTPLHLACMDVSVSTEVEAANMILQAYPAAASVRDVNGRTPLFYLVSRNETVPLEFLQKLVSTCPGTARVADCFDVTPLSFVRDIDNKENVHSVLEILDRDGQSASHVCYTQRSHPSR